MSCLYRVLIPEPTLCKLKASPVQVVGSGIRTGLGRLDISGLYSRSRCHFWERPPSDAFGGGSPIGHQYWSLVLTGWPNSRQRKDLGSVVITGTAASRSCNWECCVARQLVKKEIMNKQKILINHWRWLQQQGPSYKHQAASCKLQAASLTRDLYCVIGYSRRKKLWTNKKF